MQMGQPFCQGYGQIMCHFSFYLQSREKTTFCQEWKFRCFEWLDSYDFRSSWSISQQFPLMFHVELWNSWWVGSKSFETLGHISNKLSFLNDRQNLRIDPKTAISHIYTAETSDNEIRMIAECSNDSQIDWQIGYLFNSLREMEWV